MFFWLLLILLPLGWLAWRSLRSPPGDKAPSPIAAYRPVQPSPVERGTVVFETPPTKIGEVGGMTISSSVFIKKFSMEEIAAAAHEDMRFFEPAYWQVVSTIEASEARLRAMLPLLSIAHSSGDSRKMHDLVRQHLPEGAWRWPAYEAFSLARDTESYQDELKDIRQYSLPDLLTCQKVPALRALFKAYAGAKAKSPGAKKADIVASLMEKLTPEEGKSVAAKLRDDLLASIEPPGSPDFREMTILLCTRISLLTYHLKRKAQCKEMADDLPMWKFHAFDRPDMPVACRRRNGKKYRHDDPVWDQVIPCDYLECGCHFSVDAERGLASRK